MRLTSISCVLCFAGGLLFAQPSMPRPKPTCAELRQRLKDFQDKERSEVRGMKEGDIREAPAPCVDKLSKNLSTAKAPENQRRR